MFVTLSLSRCWNVQSWMMFPGKRGLAVSTTLRNRMGSVPEILDPSRRWSTTTSMLSSVSSSASSSSTRLSKEDEAFLAEAVEHAKIGYGHTFPNPAVGCILVRQDTGDVIGTGFHPKAGFPHGEIFGLLEAAGHVESGIDAARNVIDNQSELSSDLQSLFDEYKNADAGGPEKLFGGIFEDVPVTAYVTLEPCCHYGKTPPCAASLALAKVDRVVVGFRDPNPRVDGGGVKVLQDAGVEVDMTEDKGCARIVNGFVKRIRPKDYDAETYSHVTGAMRRGLRRIAGQKKADDTMQQVSWGGRVKATTEESVDELDLPAEWMEHLDALLWNEEMVNIRLNKAVQKKKLAKHLGNRIAAGLGAHVAQVVGHTVLLYRPGVPPVLDLGDLANDDTDDDN
jgi:pyrimidine deaminase RibD-like protein